MSDVINCGNLQLQYKADLYNDHDIYNVFMYRPTSYAKSPLFQLVDLMESWKVSQLYVLWVIWKFSADHCLILSCPFLFFYAIIMSFNVIVFPINTVATDASR